MQSAKKGSVLVLSLWVLFFLAALTVAAAGHVWAMLQVADRLQSRVVGRIEASSMAAWAVAVLEDQLEQVAVTNVWDGVSADAWNRNESLFVFIREDGTRVENAVYFIFPGEDAPQAGIIGESGRLHLNSENPELLKRLFAYVGGESGARVARALFQDADGKGVGLTGGGDASYDRKTFRAVEDLLMVDGVDADLYATLSPHVTVYGRGDTVNVNSATHAVLVAYLLATDDADIVSRAEVLAHEIISARTERGFAGRRDFEERIPALAGGVWGRWPMGTSSTAFRGIAVGEGRGGQETGLEIEFVWDTIAGQYVVWRER